MNWNGRKVLITGAGGFIGSHLAEVLVESGADVRAMVRYNGRGQSGWLDSSSRKNDLEIVSGDVMDPDSVLKAMTGVEVVFHLAALIAIPFSYEAPTLYQRVNVEGTSNVLRAARMLGTRRVVHTSTSEVYGSAQFVPISEDHPLQGQSPYSASKIGADKLAESFFRSFSIPVVTVRPFNTYGPRQSARAVIPTVILQCLAGKQLKLGHLHPTRDFNYVADTVRGFMLAGLADGIDGETINLATGQEISVGELVHTVARICGRADVAVEVEERRLRPGPSEVERLLGDAGKAFRLLGWRSQVPLEEGLRRMVEWVRGNPDAYAGGNFHL